MEDLTSLHLNQKEHGSFVCRASEPDLLFRVESNDFSNFSECFKISQQKSNKPTDESEEQLRIDQAKVTDGKAYLASY